MALVGSDFVAVGRLTDKAGNVLAMPGEPCDKVPSGSLEWLLADGHIVEKAKPASRPSRRKE